ncbi:DUF4440 domain-containing protein [Edaphosphingomonas haloaromaticamans]|uniref:DUF4440 domain-containing protein n=1 Tax=Edaphosphingomonas haloaromaticamans TaxID=653954 RepID=A0A1S1HFF9_9SPHN|nr:nuclear transport factor 2 family protein [Sphingomonas haloaromaticamans]OHT20965.1 hypothetical protein BHE75_02970 [Sphingomonas haloaromaticamans]
MDAALAGFTEAMDRCWLEQRFGDLAAYLAEDVVMVAPGGSQRISGLDAAIESYRAFMRRSEIRAFRAFDHIVTERGPAAVIEYGWHMAWADGDGEHEANGREILALARRDAGWRVIWRMQLTA